MRPLTRLQLSSMEALNIYCAKFDNYNCNPDIIIFPFIQNDKSMKLGSDIIHLSEPVCDMFMEYCKADVSY